MAVLFRRLQLWCVIFLIHLSFAHDIVKRDQTLLTADYAVLNVNRFNLSLLLDIRHNMLTVKYDDRDICYVLDLTHSHRSALHLIVHIFRQGGRVLDSEFTVDHEVVKGEIGGTLGSEFTRFCLHLRVVFLTPTQGTDNIRTTQASDVRAVTADLIG